MQPHGIPRLAPAAATAFVASMAALGLVLALLAVSERGASWVGLIVVAALAAALCALSAQPRLRLLQAAVLAITIDISKGLVEEGGVYAPGLSLHIADPFIAGYLALWCVERVRRAEPMRLAAPAKLALAYVAYLWLSVAWSEYPLAGFFAALAHTKYVLLFILVADDVRTVAQLRAVLHALAAAVALNATLGVLQVLTRSALMPQGAKVSDVLADTVFQGAGVSAFRATGFMSHPNALADLLVLALPALLALALLGRSGLRDRFLPALGLLALGTGVLVATLSRGGWIAFGAAAAVVVLMLLRARLVPVRRIVLLAAATGAAVALAIAVYPAALQRVVLEDNRSIDSRVLMMDQAVLIVRENPVLGVGLGGYTRAARDATPESFADVSVDFQSRLRKGIVHNKYLLVAAESGVIGLLLFAWLAWRLLAAYFAAPAWRHPAHQALGIGLMAGLGGQALFFAFDHFHSGPPLQLWWLCAAVLAALVAMQGASRSPA